MTAESSPRPWKTVGTYRDIIVGADGVKVCELYGELGTQQKNAALIVAAVNERDKFRDLVRRLIPAVEESFAIANHEAESIKGICALMNVDSSEVDAVLSQWENLLQEARTAIREEGRLP